MVDSEVVQSRSGLSLEASREVAVSQVFRGGSLALLGSAGLLTAIYELLGVASLPIGLGSVLIGGAGLLHLARAAGHLKRYGSRTAMVGFVGAGVLGVGVLAWVVAVIPQIFGIGRAPLLVRQTIPLLILASALIVLVTVILGVTRLITQAMRGDDEGVALPPSS